MAPRTTMPGEQLPLTVVLTARKKLPVRHVDVTLHGIDLFRVQGNSSVGFCHEVLRSHQRICGAGKLDAGTTRFGCCFSLPSEAPPSFTGVHAGVHYMASVHVDIPWWPDARAEFEVHVGWPPLPQLTGQARTYATGPGRFHGVELTVGLDRDVVISGEQLEATVQLSGRPTRNHPSAVRASLVAKEIGPLNVPEHGQRYSFEAFRFQCLDIPMEHLVSGSQLPITLGIPRKIPPSFHSFRWELSWALRLESVQSWGGREFFDVPLMMLPPDRDTDGAAQMIKLSPGRPRWAIPTVVTEGGQMVWQRVADRHGLFFDGHALHGRTGGAAIAITCELRAGQQAHVVSRLDFAPLHLGIKIRPAKGVEHLGGGLAIGHPAWDSKFRVTGRDARQVSTLLHGSLDTGTPLFELLQYARRLEMDDDQLRFWWLTGHTEQLLNYVADHARKVALALEQARHQIPAPRAMQEAIPAWEALASRLHAELEATDMSINGLLHGFPFEVRTEWAAQAPLQTVVQLRAPEGPQLPGQVHPLHSHQLTLELDSIERLADADLSELPDAAHELLPQLLEGTRWFQLAPGSASVALEAPLLDPAPTEARLGQLMRLMAVLTAGDGPYR